MKRPTQPDQIRVGDGREGGRDVFQGWGKPTCEFSYISGLDDLFL